MQKHKKEIGDIGERYAVRYLQSLGHRLITTNYICRQGEIDIISLDGDILVFTEVRTRSYAGAVSSEESITNEKKRRIRLAAEHYLTTHHQDDEPICRFDVIALTYDQKQWTLRYYSDAF